MERNSFVFYRSFYEAIVELPREVQGEVLTAVIEYGLNGVTTEPLKPIARGMLALIKPMVDANNQRFRNGCKGAASGKLGGRPKHVADPQNEPKETPQETPKKPQRNPKKTPNVDVNVNADVNVNEKKDDPPFIPPVISEVVAYFDEKGYSEEAASNFFAYYDELSWCDKNGNSLKNWKLKAINVWFKPEHRKQKKTNRWGLAQ